MKIDSLRDMTKDELLQKRLELKEDLFNLKMRKTLKELDNPLRLRTLRRDLARIETILMEDIKSIRKIVDSPVSILDRHSDKGTDKKSEQSESSQKSE